ncbi:hypothetical protein DY000_02048371 [Brassica cretica]|uniref:Uncharacterized protein n=1 Tax=Brassica cretica TaxID=69181 RepID=A0ABQ7EV10_BRACR|nr:hypothetical protein DY000_02048371 [Brassica cretica]
MPSSARSNKETPLLFSIDPASLERLIRKERRFSSIDNNTSSSINTCQPTSTQTPISSTDTRSPLSTESTLPSTDIFLPTSIDTSSQTSIDTEPRNMVATLVLVRDENGDLHDQEVHLRNAASQRIYAQGTTNRTQASTDIAYYTSIDNEVDHAQEGKYSIGSWADDHYHESYAVETTIYEPQADEFHEGFTTEELFNHRERSYTNSLFAEACGKGTHFYRPLSRAKRPSIDNNASTSIDNFPKPPSIENEKAKQNNDYLTLDEFGIFSDPEGYRVTKEFYDTAGGVDDRFKPKYRQHTHPSIDRRPEFGKGAYNRDGIRRFHWEQKDEYGVYIDEYEHARGVDGHIIHVSKDDIRNLLEIASMDEHIYICLPEHARSFTQTKLVLEIYTKDEINEILYGISGAQGKNEDDF